MVSNPDVWPTFTSKIGASGINIVRANDFIIITKNGDFAFIQNL